MTDISDILDYLYCRTPDSWIKAALNNLDLILLDHAANELKAAQSAMTLIAKNPVKIDLLNKMSRLAREELRHFEQVLQILKQRGIAYEAIKASRYASSLAQHIRKKQQDQLVDTLIVGSIIEARSCERFDRLAPYLDKELEKFYLGLLKSEARHFKDYLGLARKYADGGIDDRVAYFLELDKQAILTQDPLLRFHSGVPNQESAVITG